MTLFYSLIYHYFRICVQKKLQYPRNFFYNSYKQNLMANENKALRLNFPEKQTMPKKIHFHDQKGLKFL